MKGLPPPRMPVYGPGSKCLGRTENETEWRRFDVPQAPGNSHCAPTVARSLAVSETSTDGVVDPWWSYARLIRSD
jgi:hypothetical protein